MVAIALDEVGDFDDVHAVKRRADGRARASDVRPLRRRNPVDPPSTDRLTRGRAVAIRGVTDTPADLLRPLRRTRQVRSSPTSRSIGPTSTRSPMSPAGRGAAATPSRGGSSSLPTSSASAGSPRSACRRPARCSPRPRRSRSSCRSTRAMRSSLAYDDGRAAERILIAAGMLELGAGIAVGPVGRPRARSASPGAAGGSYVRTIVALGHPTEAALAPKTAPGEAASRATERSTRSAGRPTDGGGNSLAERRLEPTPYDEPRPLVDRELAVALWRDRPAIDRQADPPDPPFTSLRGQRGSTRDSAAPTRGTRRTLRPRAQRRPRRSGRSVGGADPADHRVGSSTWIRRSSGPLRFAAQPDEQTIASSEFDRAGRSSPATRPTAAAPARPPGSRCPTIGRRRSPSSRRRRTGPGVNQRRPPGPVGGLRAARAP